MGQSEIKVLLVEDNPGDVRLIQELLKEANGGKFEFAHLPRLAELESRLQSFDAHILLLDLGLPESQGLESLIKTKAIASHLPIVILTGLFGDELGVEAVANGAQDYLVKGQVDANLLSRTIRYAIERKRVEAAVREREQQLSSIYDTVGDVIYHLAVEKDGRYRFISVNQAFVTTTGIDSAQVVGKLVNEIVPEPSLTLVLQKYKEAIREKKIVRWEETSEYPTGRLTGEVSVAPVFDDAGNCTHLVGGVHDITERKQAEDALREREKRLKKAQQVAHMGFLDLDLKTNEIIVSDEAIRIHGLDKVKTPPTLEQVVQACHPDDRAYARQNLEVAIGGGKQYDIDHRILHPDGKIVWVHAQAELDRAADGTPITLLGTVVDITAHKRAEEEIRKLNEELEERVRQRTAQLEAANKELEAFSYSVSHDLRAPLRAIDGFSRLLIEQHSSQLDDEGQRFLKITIDSTAKMGQLIDDLLTFSRLSRQEMRKWSVDMEKLARTLADDAKKAEPERTLEVTIHSLPPANCDGSMIRQVWLNLISNAFKFTRRQANPRVEIGSYPDGRDTVYFVKDNGAGFDMQYVEKLFGVFQRLHRQEEYEGTGVGLGIVQRVVHRHGGHVWAEGKVNKGATFYFTLPTEGETSS